jgi:hypothetical protein
MLEPAKTEGDADNPVILLELTFNLYAKLDKNPEALYA